MKLLDTKWCVPATVALCLVISITCIVVGAVPGTFNMVARADTYGYYVASQGGYQLVCHVTHVAGMLVTFQLIDDGVRPCIYQWTQVTPYSFGVGVTVDCWSDLQQPCGSNNYVSVVANLEDTSGYKAAQTAADMLTILGVCFLLVTLIIGGAALSMHAESRRVYLRIRPTNE